MLPRGDFDPCMDVFILLGFDYSFIIVIFCHSLLIVLKSYSLYYLQNSLSEYRGIDNRRDSLGSSIPCFRREKIYPALVQLSLTSTITFCTVGQLVGRTVC